MSISSAVLGAVKAPPLVGQNGTLGHMFLLVLGIIAADIAWFKILKEGGAL